MSAIGDVGGFSGLVSSIGAAFVGLFANRLFSLNLAYSLFKYDNS